MMIHRFRNMFALVAAAAWLSAQAGAQQPQQGQQHDHDAHHRDMLTRGGQAMGFDHDAATMAEMGDIHELFVNHDRITRTVTNLPNGIRTVTQSADPRIAQLLKDHVTSMGQRVESGKDPGLPIESPALRSIYRNYDKIHTTFEPTATGIVVVQTSSDRETVAALQQHASEVTDFVKGGMSAMHAAMMKNGGMMQPGMRGRMMETAPQRKTTPNPR